MQELHELLASGQSFCFIDVREEWEYAEFNLGARNIPLALLPSYFDELAEWKDGMVVVHCKMGRRGQQAQLLLRQAGFNRVYNLSGGIDAWITSFGCQAPRQ